MEESFHLFECIDEEREHPEKKKSTNENKRQIERSLPYVEYESIVDPIYTNYKLQSVRIISKRVFHYHRHILLRTKKAMLDLFMSVESNRLYRNDIALDFFRD